MDLCLVAGGLRFAATTGYFLSGLRATKIKVERDCDESNANAFSTVYRGPKVRVGGPEVT